MRGLWLLLVPAVLGGCAWLVPDREQEYLKARQLPPLKLPTEIHSGATLTIQPPQALPTQSPPPLPPALTTAPYIELNQPLAEAWVTTLKALNLLRLELIKRDPQQGSLELVHTPAEQELAEDRGWREDLLYFITGAGALREEKYRLLLVPAGNATRLYLLDREGKPRTDRTTLNLLEQIKQTLATLTHS
ncbi:MAG: outer membrane protein assembly factor BamC [Methylohalobius sp.]